MAASSATASAAPTTAGGLLRQARQAQGLHIAALAAAIKVVPRKLELLESDQFDQLPDATFTRALAHTVCRTLKIDAAPILALLPPPKGHRLEQVAEGLNTPFLDRPGRLVPKDFANVSSPVLWIAGLIVVMTAAVYAMPAAWLDFSKAAVTRPRAADTAAAPTVAVPLVATPAPAASALPEPIAPAAAAASEPFATTAPDAVTTEAASGVLQFRANAESWVEVTDARGQSLISRVLQAGESVGLDGVPPLKVRIGNASGTQVTFRGQPVELAKSRDNLAKLELK
ncbi:MAG: helix-turn-helix domain-containing protein [Pseudomonadota bacterium]